MDKSKRNGDQSATSCCENLDKNIPCNGCDIRQNLKPVKLERVLGFTVSGNASLRSDPNTGTIIYPAGCAIVLFSPRKNKQSHILNVSKKTVTSLDVSSDGKYVVTGECGHLPNVRVWDIQEKAQVAEFTGHKYGINCVAFSPNLKYVVSVGSQHDMIVSVWDFRSGVKVASNKVSSKVKAVAFSEDGSYFVTVGNRHVKFWYLKCSSKTSKYNETVPLMGRSAILGEKRNNYFCDVACGKSDIAESTFSITKTGLLCEFNRRRLLDRWVELRTQGANCLTVGTSLIFIGCVDGIVRCFNPYTLEYVTTLPRSHYLGVDVAMGLSIAHMAVQSPNAKYPDIVAITFDETNRKVTCVYSDHSMYVWDVKDIKKVGKSHSFLYHSACIWGVEVYPETYDSQRSVLPAGSFITCSSDDTIRIWNLDPAMPNNTIYRKNLYCNELLKIVYVDEGLTYLCDMDRNPGGSNDKVDATYDTKNGVRCIRISPDGLNLASGDRSGNIRIHELQRMGEVCNIEAHDGEVLNLEYSKPDTGYRFLASASRDRLIHVLDVDQDYAFLQTLDDHSSSITAVRFVQVDGRLQMISCGADKSIIFRTAQLTPQLQFSRDHHIVGKTTLYDMEVDVEQKNILTACQDRHIRVYSVGNGKHAKSFKGSIGEDGTLIKVVLDSSGLFAATSCTDKNLCVYNYTTGECVATMYGHSELVTGLRFSNDCKHLISVSGDGCIFIWKLPLEITHQMQVRLAQIAPKIKQSIRKTSSPQRPSRPHSTGSAMNGSGEFRSAQPDMFDAHVGEMDNGGLTDYRFSIGQLPKWAKKEIADEASQTVATEKSVSISQPKGRWAQRIDTQGLVVRSFYSNDHVIPYPGQIPDKGAPMPSENFMENQFRKYTDIRRETIVISKQEIANDHADFLPCPESLHDIQFGSNAQSNSRSPTTVSTRRGSEMTFGSPRRRLTTEPSNTSNLLPTEDMYLEHDGDAEDEESIETDHSADMDGEIIYYPQVNETLEAGEGGFKVLATNQDELRAAHRRMRKGKAERPTDLPIAGHDSEEEEEVVTPQSGDRSILSMLNVSMESLDRVGQREKFMKSTYDSLEGDAVNGKEEEASSTTTGFGSSLTDEGEHLDEHRQSLSARYLYQSNPTTPLRNVAVLNASKQRNEVTSQKRQEIMRQIANTRRKLDTIGWKASMNASKSIGDLTDLPEKDYPGGRYFSTSKDASAQESIRRTSSMIDLSKPRRLLPSPTTDVTPPKVPTPRSNGRSLLTPPRPSTAMARSTSMGTLNPSESDSDASAGTKPSNASSLARWNGSTSTRHTISSLNKLKNDKTNHEQVPAGGRTTPAIRISTARASRNAEVERRRVASGGLENRRGSDSSSGENSPTDTRPPSRGGPGFSFGSTQTLPRHHGRTSTGSLSLASRSRSEKDLSKVGGHDSGTSRPSYTRRSTSTTSTNGTRGPKPSAVNGHMLEKSPQELPVKDNLPQPIDVTSAPLSRELCDATAQGLKQSADNMLQLYKRVTMDSDMHESERMEMLNSLCDGTTQAQQTLRPIASGSCMSSQQNSVGGITKDTDSLPWKLSDTTSGNENMNGPPSLFPLTGRMPLDQNQFFQQCAELFQIALQQRMGPQT